MVGLGRCEGVTQRHRDHLKHQDRANLKSGTDHELDQLTPDDLGRDQTGRPRRGKAGISHLLDSVYFSLWLAILDWQIAHADWKGASKTLTRINARA